MTTRLARRLARPIAFSAIAGMLFTTACKDRITDPEQKPDTPRVHSVQLNSSTYTMEVGDTLRALAVLLDAFNKQLSDIPAGVTLTWTSSDTTIVRISSSGLLEARGPGEAQVTLTVTTSDRVFTATGTVIVAGGAGQLVIVSGNEQVARIGTVLPDSLIVRIVDGEGTPVPNVTVTFAADSSGSVSPASQTTDDSGLARTAWTLGAEPGTQQARATADGLAEAVFTATATEPAASVVQVAPAADTLQIGGSVQLTAVVTDDLGNPMTDPEIAWTTDSAAIATVDANGLVTAIAPGVAVITASSGTASGIATITVERVPNQLPTVLITAPSDSAEYQEEEVVTFQGSATDPEDGALTGNALVWRADGVQIGFGVSISVDTLPVGAHVITLTATDSESASAVARINVTITEKPNQPPIAAIASPANGASFTAGVEVAFQGSGTDPEDGALAGDALVWATGGSEIGRGASFATTALAVGNHTVVLTATDTEGLTGTAQITIEIAPAPIVCTDTVTLGNGATLQGNLPSVRVTGAVTVTGSANICGSMLVASSGNLNVGAHTVDVEGEFTTDDRGQLTMQDADGLLRIGGNALFSGGSTAGLLTNGRIEVTGNFTQRRGTSGCCGSYPQSFQASGSHVVVLNGTGTQVLDFENAGTASDQSRFNTLTITNLGNVQVISALALRLNVDAATTVEGSGTLQVRNTITTAPGSRIITSRVMLYGPMAIAGTFSPDTVWFEGTRQTIQSGLDYRHVIALGDTIDFDGNTTITGNLSILDRAILEIGPNTVDVNGDFTTDEVGRLAMRDAAGVLRVRGNALFGGGTTASLLTAGALEVAGNFAQVRGSSGCCNSYPQSFLASGSHRLVLNGAAPQTVSFENPGRTANNSRIAHLRISNPSSITIGTDVTVAGTVDVTSAATIEGTAALDVGSTITSVAGSEFVLSNVVFRGASMNIGGTFSPDTLFFDGTSTQLIQGGLAYKNVVVRGSALLDIGGETVDVSESFRVVNTGRLQMQNAAGLLRVTGDVYIGGRDTNGLLTAGNIEVGGSFTQRRGSSGCCNSYSQSFQASGSHTVLMNGTSPQTIDFNTGGATSTTSRFAILRIAAGAAVTFAGNPVVGGSLDLIGHATVPEAVTLPITGTLFLRSTSVLDNNGTMTVGTCQKEAGHTINGTDPCPG